MRLTRLLQRVLPRSPENQKEWDKAEIQRDKLNLAHDAAMLQDAREVLRSNRRATGAGLYTQFGDSMDNESAAGPIHIGDVTHEAKPERGMLLKGLLAATAGAGLLGGGIGLSKFLEKPAQVIEKPIETIIDKTKGKAVDFDATLIPPDGR